ncbi:hypothetical protein [Thalassotalea litorea]|uniref:hypothetical protein n=1 Tax=Thalassotalea litorea TaxID=2020715 RepID=UPI0037369277
MLDQITQFEPYSYLGHVIIGFLALIAGTIALKSVKGSVTHVRMGRVFALSTLVACLTAYYFFYQQPLTLLSAIDATLAIYLVFSAILAFEKYERLRKALAFIYLPVVACLIFLLAPLIVQNLSIPMRVVVLMIHLALLATLAIGDIQFGRVLSPSRSQRLARHRYRMLLAYSVIVAAAIGNILNLPVPVVTALFLLGMAVFCIVSQRKKKKTGAFQTNI